MSPEPLATSFRQHFGHREHLYGHLLAEMADDLDAGGVTREVCRDHLNASRADAVQLRLLAGIFRLVLSGDAPELRRFYPALGGTDDPASAWPFVESAMHRHVDELRSALDLAPQTNEVGRAALLAIGLFVAVRHHGLRQVRLLEPGASAGLNLLLDHYRFTGPGWSYGPPDSPLHLDTEAAGVTPEEFVIVERRGCDLAPVSATSGIAADYLTSFVWPFHLERHRRLDAALAIARQHPVEVDRRGAADWLADQLARPTDDAVLTVVWHSITEQYWPQQESAAVARLIAEARTRIPLAHVSMEGVPPPDAGYDIRAHGPITSVDGVPVARSHHHGPPVILTDQARADGSRVNR